jgi:chorismate-pyruvate lyase
MNDSMDTELLTDLTTLSRFQKILLITDGTVTTLLEHFVDEPIIVYKLNEVVEQKESAKVLQREIFLQGKQSGKNWLYAESSVFINHLSADFRHDLMTSNQPIGKLWIKYQLETYKSIISIEEETADTLAPYFHIDPQDRIISRTYRVLSQKKVIMVITEKFPLSFFQD